MTDYLIVGSGLAGIAFAETALQRGKSILVVDAELYHSSKVAAGLINPVVLKRLTGLADAEVHLDLADKFYSDLENKLESRFFFRLPLLRKFQSVEEQNNWFAAADKPALSPFLSTDLVFKKFEGIDSPFGFGKVNRTGYVNTIRLINVYKAWLAKNEFLLEESFDHSLFAVQEDRIRYKGLSFQNVIFAEGFGMHQNPFFGDLPLNGTKGEILTIKAPALSLDVAINASVFILPLGNGLFKVGATYNWSDKTEIPTEEAKSEIFAKLKEIITCDFEIVDQQAGIRPTVKDRKPLVGTHESSNRIHILNGLGTRGVMLAPAMAKHLFDHIELGIQLPREIDIRRFSKKA